MKEQTCKYTLEDGTVCSSPYHTAMFHKERKPIKRTAIKKPNNQVLQKQVSIKRKNKNIAKSKEASRKATVKKLDNIFSWYIRLRGSVDHNGTRMAICITCKSMKPWQDQQNGHFFTRGRQSTRWDEMNCHVQCMRCNVFLKGNYITYTTYMIDTYGRDAMDYLERRSLTPHKITTVKLNEMIEYYKGEVDLLLK